MDLPFGLIRARTVALWRTVRSSYWFLPGLMAAGAIAAALLSLALDLALAGALAGGPSWLTVLGPATARAVLSTLAASMLSVAALVFSIVIVAFSLAATQYGPRLVTHFMRDTGVQLSLGTFVASFLYSVLVLRAVVGEGERAFVPHVSLHLAIAAGVVSLGVLIYFFHHAAELMQAGEVVARAGDWLEKVVHSRFSGRSDGEGEIPLPGDFDRDSKPIRADRTGYLAGLGAKALIEIAVEHDLVLRAEVRDGEFIAPGVALLTAYPAESVDEGVERELRGACSLVVQRGEATDAELAVDRLVQIALRALSPALNDPFTAMECIDRLGSGLARIGEAGAPDRTHRDDDGNLRLLLPEPHRHRLLDHAFHQIRHNGRDNLRVLLRVLEALRLVADRCPTGDRELTDAIRRHADAVRETGAAELGLEWERERLAAAYERVTRRLGDGESA